MSRKKFIKIILILVLIGLSFYGGMQYVQSRAPQGRGAFAGGMGTKFRGSANGGGATQGAVLSKDATGITIQLRNGGSQVILVSSSTQIMKTVPALSSDVSAGTNVMIIGTANSDGSFTASSIQIRNSTSTPR